MAAIPAVHMAVNRKIDVAFKELLEETAMAAIVMLSC
jgi:hypothetical protein